MMYIFWRCRACGIVGTKRVERLSVMTMPYRCKCGGTDMIRQSNKDLHAPPWASGSVEDIPPPRPTTPEERGDLRCHVIEAGDCVVCGCAATRECPGQQVPDWYKMSVRDGHMDYFNYKEQWVA